MNYIDKQTWSSYLGSNEELFAVIAKSFLTSYKNFVNKISEAVNKNDLDELYNLIHSLKGITLNLGMNQLYEVSSKILVKIKDDFSYEKEIIPFIDIFNLTYDELDCLFLAL